MSDYTNKIVDGVSVPLTDDEIAALEAQDAAWAADATNRLLAELRPARNLLIASTDYRMLPDYAGSDVDAWKTYRQQLRDLPDQDWTGKEYTDVVWPTPPA
jgi:hypothetical protein